MENVNKQPGLSKISEVKGAIKAIKEIEHENSSEEISSENEKENNKSKKNESLKKEGSHSNSQISRKSNKENIIEGDKLELKNSEEDDEEKKSSENNENSEKSKEQKEKSFLSENSSEDEGNKNESKSISNSQYKDLKEENFHSIEEYYAELRKYIIQIINIKILNLVMTKIFLVVMMQKMMKEMYQILALIE